LNVPDIARIAVEPPAAFEQLRSLLQGLRELYPVEFVPCDSIRTDVAGRLVRSLEADAPMAPLSGIPTFVFQVDGVAADSDEVRFSKDPSLDPLLQGRIFREDAGVRRRPLANGTGVRVLAWHGGEAVWIKRDVGGTDLDVVGLELPALHAAETLVTYLQRGRCVQLLPLLHWLNDVTADQGWRRPPLRAAFMFDDPNLRRPTYGFVHYAKLAAHAREHNYHASMATIPIDVGGVDERAASLFRDNRDCLSLLIHGNNHTHRELAGGYSPAERQALVSQALQRIEKLERKSGLRVARVMAAPHGACNEPMAAALARGGFESACISRGSLLRHNPATRWNPAFGLRLAESLETLPVFPRFALRRDCEFEVVLAAFLCQPVIPVGHHQDLRRGLDVLAHVATLVNQLGASVSWANLEEISRSNYQVRLVGKTAVIRLFARWIRLLLPPEIEHVHILRSWPEPDGPAEQLELLDETGRQVWTGAAHSAQRVPTNAASRRLEIRVRSGVVPTATGPARIKPWALLRRSLAEGRDRLLPVVSRFSRPARIG
jgi:hypothetical protein